MKKPVNVAITGAAGLALVIQPAVDGDTRQNARTVRHVLGAIDSVGPDLALAATEPESIEPPFVELQSVREGPNAYRPILVDVMKHSLDLWKAMDEGRDPTA